MEERSGVSSSNMINTDVCSAGAASSSFLASGASCLCSEGSLPSSVSSHSLEHPSSFSSFPSPASSSSSSSSIISPASSSPSFSCFSLAPIRGASSPSAVQSVFKVERASMLPRSEKGDPKSGDPARISSCGGTLTSPDTSMLPVH